MNTIKLKKRLSKKAHSLKLVLHRDDEMDQSHFEIRTPDKLDFSVRPLQAASEEYLISIHLDVLLDVTGFLELSPEDLLYPREMFEVALQANSHSMILIHNSPSGMKQPSDKDLEIMKLMCLAGRILDVDVLDHLIVTKDAIISLRGFYPSVFE